jgi:hypothetical protein
VLVHTANDVEELAAMILALERVKALVARPTASEALLSLINAIETSIAPPHPDAVMTKSKKSEAAQTNNLLLFEILASMAQRAGPQDVLRAMQYLTLVQQPLFNWCVEELYAGRDLLFKVMSAVSF